MDKEFILEDIKEFLSTTSKFTQKNEVVYFLAEVRKIIENGSDKDKYKYLRLYCNWVLHTKLTHEPIIKLLSSIFDKYIDFNKSKREIQNALARADNGNFIKLNNFKIELKKFLKNYELSTDILKGNRWYEFVKLYLKIIKKCPIGSDVSRINGLRLIEDNDGHYFEFYLNIRIPKIKLKLKNKK